MTKFYLNFGLLQKEKLKNGTYLKTTFDVRQCHRRCGRLTPEIRRAMMATTDGGEASGGKGL